MIPIEMDDLLRQVENLNEFTPRSDIDVVLFKIRNLNATIPEERKVIMAAQKKGL